MEKETFTVLSYNIDARDYDIKARVEAVLELVRIRDPTFVLLQEVVLSSYGPIMREMGFMGYKRVGWESTETREHEMIFSKLQIKNSHQIQFPRTRNELSVFEVHLSDLFRLSNLNVKSDRVVWLCTSKLHSESTTRDNQIGIISKLLANVGDTQEHNVILGMDTQALSYHTLTEPEGWYDAWYESGTEDNEFTVDPRYNTAAPGSCRDRPDRVWYRPSIDNPIECTGFELVGQSDVPISSHFGILTTFEFGV